MHIVRREIEPRLALEPRPPSPPAPRPPQHGKKRLFLALGVLLVALSAVILKDWDFWFPPAPGSEYVGPNVARSSPKPAATESLSAPPANPPAVSRQRKPVTPADAGPIELAATAERTALPDLQVEVVAGNQRRRLPARSNAIHLDLASPSSNTAPGANASHMASKSQDPVHQDDVQMSQPTAHVVNRSVVPDYPLLARQMKVQGAVVLQALISREGSIQELRILSGPDILAAAAREAVKRWHFKPYYQNGQPVETQARIQVNFTISTN